MELIPSMKEEISQAEKSVGKLVYLKKQNLIKYFKIKILKKKKKKIEFICSKIEMVEELLTQKLKEKQTSKFEMWNNSKALEVTQERANFDSRIHNLEKSLVEKRQDENQKEFSTKKKIMKVFENTFKLQVEQYLKFGIVPKPEKEESPTEEKVENVDITETLQVEDEKEFENFLGDDEEEDEDEDDDSAEPENDNSNQSENLEQKETENNETEKNNETEN